VTWQAGFWLAAGLDVLAVARWLRIRGHYRRCRDVNKELLLRILS
jgi:hypothetical protein